MKEDTIKIIRPEDFKQYEGIVDYMDEDIIMINKWEDTAHSNEAIKFGGLLFVFCLEGSVRVKINSSSHLIQTNDAIIIQPNAIFSHSTPSARDRMGLIGFSTRFLQHAMKLEKKMWNTAFYYYNNPVIHTGKENNIFRHYKELIMAKINSGPHLCHKEIMRHLFSALFTEITIELDKGVPQDNTTNKSQNCLRQADYIFHRFINKLSADDGTHRSISYYADTLFCTPKHLSKVIKEISGRTPLELINEHTIELVKYRLKHSEKAVKEIAEEFKFSNPSFFGKYVKKHLGVSPQQYRDRPDYEQD